MKKMLNALQILLKLSLVFIISFIWLRFFLDSIWISFAGAIIIASIFELFHTLIKRKKTNKENLKLKEKEDADNMFFSLLTEGKYLKFYQELLKTRYNNPVIKKKYIEIEKDSKTVFYPHIKFENLDINSIIQIILECKSSKPDKIIIVCYDYDKDVLSFAKNFNENIVLINRYEVYSLYKEYQFFPEITQELKKEARPTFKDLLSFSFNKSRSKGYIISSLILFMTSFFVKINIYYCIVSSILLLFALISFINPKYNSKKIKDII